MILIKKFFVYLLILILSVFVASVFGVVHNQFSYTVSPEYFTKFKFEQFGFADFPPSGRVLASIVGLLSSWWMGLLLGSLFGAAGFIQPDHRRMLKVSLHSILFAVGVTSLFSLGGLLYGYFKTQNIELSEYDGWFIPDGITNLRRFLCAGYMHNSSYLGGVLAALVTLVYQVVIGVRTKSRKKKAPCNEE